MKKQEVTKNINEKALRDNFDGIQKQIDKWSKAYPLFSFEHDEESGIHYIEEANYDYKVSTSSGSAI